MTSHENQQYNLPGSYHVVLLGKGDTEGIEGLNLNSFIAGPLVASV